MKGGKMNDIHFYLIQIAPILVVVCALGYVTWDTKQDAKRFNEKYQELLDKLKEYEYDSE
jgi:hypothetical protein